MLQHQQNMLQDYIRTGTYYAAILENKADFEGKAVMDVGCGSGILSLFAAQAGARVVYAVEASGMARFAQQLAAANPVFGSRIRVLHGKVEEIELPEKVGARGGHGAVGAWRRWVPREGHGAFVTRSCTEVLNLCVLVVRMCGRACLS